MWTNMILCKYTYVEEGLFWKVEKKFIWRKRSVNCNQTILHFFFENIQYAQKRKERRKKVLEIIKKSQKLSTSKNVEISKKRSYTPSYTHYPQKNRHCKGDKFTKKQEQMFCEHVIKIIKWQDLSILGLTYRMSKTSKKLLKLLQKAVLLCYNDYTINTRDAT